MTTREPDARDNPTDLESRESEERLHAIVNTAVDAIISIRHDGMIDTFNPAAEKMFGYKATEVIGSNVSILMPSPYREEHDNYIANYLETGQAKIIGIGREIVGRRRDGTTFPIELAVSEVDHLGMFIGIVRDISERKHTEQLLLRSERLAAIGEMIAGLAHESRNAFQRSQACLEMLELELEGQESALDLVRRIQIALDHLHHLYEEVRCYAAPVKLHRTKCDLSRIWRETWKHLTHRWQEKNLQLREVVTADALDCSVDQYALEQVFRNVLENAIDASPEGAEIQLRCNNGLTRDQPTILVSIRDVGSGIPADKRESVFEPFFTTKAKGTGLGMAIARRIVDSHSGTISLSPNDSHAGAEFVIELPIDIGRDTHEK